MLQALNIDWTNWHRLPGIQYAKYLHALPGHEHEFHDRDFYYGDPYFPPVEPINGLLSKDCKGTHKQINWEKNDTTVAPGTLTLPREASILHGPVKEMRILGFDAKPMRPAGIRPSFYAGTTRCRPPMKSDVAVSVTPAAAGLPAVVAGIPVSVWASGMLKLAGCKEEGNPFNGRSSGKATTEQPYSHLAL